MIDRFLYRGTAATEFRGRKIVLTANRTLMSEYGGGVFLGFSVCIPCTVVPERLFFSVLCPSVPVTRQGEAQFAPYGTRKIESALLEYGFPRDEIVVSHPEHLHKVVGAGTKILGLTEIDPLGLGPATSTFTQLFGGDSYTRRKFAEILNHPSVRRYRPSIVVGGPGAWQLNDFETLKELRIDHVVIGEGEKVVGPLFEDLLHGKGAPQIIHAAAVPAEEIPRISKPAVHGIVEISRGCGRGCSFCVPTLQQHRSRPVEDILAEVDLNLRAGRQPLLHAEDVLRYKCDGKGINQEAVIDLFEAVRSRPGVRCVSISHVSLSSVVEAPGLVAKISSVLGLSPSRWLGPQTGIETASPRLMKKHMAGKCAPFGPEDWPAIVMDACHVLQENNWVPSATLIMGLPGEADEDVEQTVRLVEKLEGFKSLIVPLLFVSQGRLEGRVESFALERMGPLHKELFMRCWQHNLRWSGVLFKEFADMYIGSLWRRYALKYAISFMAASIVKRFCSRLGLEQGSRSS